MAREKPMPPSIKWTLIGTALVTIIAPILGSLGTVLGMIGAFSTLGKSGTTEMAGVSSSISTVLISTAAGISVGVLSLLCFIAVLIAWLCIKKTAAESPPDIT